MLNSGCTMFISCAGVRLPVHCSTWRPPHRICTSEGRAGSIAAATGHKNKKGGGEGVGCQPDNSIAITATTTTHHPQKQQPTTHNNNPQPAPSMYLELATRLLPTRSVHPRQRGARVVDARQAGERAVGAVPLNRVPLLERELPGRLQRQGRDGEQKTEGHTHKKVVGHCRLAMPSIVRYSDVWT